MLVKAHNFISRIYKVVLLNYKSGVISEHNF